MNKEQQKGSRQTEVEHVHYSIAAQITKIENLIPKMIIINKIKSKKETEEIAKFFDPVKNENDGRIAEIPNNTIGKICGHHGYNITRIIEHIPMLYATSLFGWSEPEIPREGHKLRTNIKVFHHYINKFTDGIWEYFIRFTINEEKVKPGKVGKNKIHSTAISSTSIYKNGDSSQRIRGMYPGEANSSPFLDLRLKEFFNSVKR